MISKARSMMPWTSSGSSRSDIAVKPETSVNMTVTCLRSPSIALREVRIFSARCLGVYDSGEAKRSPAGGGEGAGSGAAGAGAGAAAAGAGAGEAGALAAAAGAAPPSLAPHSPQNLFVGTFGALHAGQS